MKKKLDVNSPEFRNLTSSLTSTKLSLPPLPTARIDIPKSPEIKRSTQIQRSSEKIRKSPELPKDVSEVVANDLSPAELVSLCASDARPDFQRLCQNNDFWIRRWKRDFSTFMTTPVYDKSNAKSSYMLLFSTISKAAEKMVSNILDEYGDYKKFLNSEFKKELYTFFF